MTFPMNVSEQDPWTNGPQPQAMCGDRPSGAEREFEVNTVSLTQKNNVSHCLVNATVSCLKRDNGLDWEIVSN